MYLFSKRLPAGLLIKLNSRQPENGSDIKKVK